MDILSAASLPWLDNPRALLEQAWRSGRLPHSLLLISIPGLGAEALAHWTAALVLCDQPDAAPCGRCASCQLLIADSHPDLKRVGLEEDAQQLKVDQIRALIESLSLSSYRSGFKVGIVESGEALNVNGANAFLKTLEEPTQSTLLILVATPSHRLPATIASRCQRLTVRAPEAEAARAWLGTQRPGVNRWDAALALAGGAPLKALELEAAGIEALEQDMRESLKRLASGTTDVTMLADRWARSDPVLRLTWLENWITTRVRTQLGGTELEQTAEPVRLPAALLKPKIRRLFELLDAARELRRLASTGLNQQLALEALLLEGRAALGR
jgi:DNA polymerase-3 subunit delta'